MLLACRILTSRTHKAYDSALTKFKSSIIGNGVTLSALDATLERHATARFKEDPKSGSRQQVVNVLAALCHRLPAWRGASELCAAVSCWLISKGRADIGTWLRVAWARLLRSREALDIRKEDVALPTDPQLDEAAENTASILVRMAKTGPRQLVLLTDDAAQTLLAATLRQPNLRPTDKIFRATYAESREWLLRAVSALGL
eukprot:IDg9350t1